MFIERPLATLPTDHAERFVRALFAPDGRFARAYHDWFRTVQGHNEPTAKLSTRIELHKASDALLGNLGDPALHTVGVQQVAANWQDAGGAASYRPIGLFGYRALTALPFGAKIAARIATTSLRTRCGGPSGIAHCVGILDEHGSLDVLKTVFLSIAHKAQAAGHDQLFFFTPDHRLRGLYTRFGIEFPEELQLPSSKHLVGMFDLAGNRARVEAIESQLAETRNSFAWAA